LLFDTRLPIAWFDANRARVLLLPESSQLRRRAPLPDHKALLRSVP
jgi:hypothetical protein